MPQGTGKSLMGEMAKIYTSLVSFSFQFKYYQYVIDASKYTHIHTKFFLLISVVFLSLVLFLQLPSPSSYFKPQLQSTSRLGVSSLNADSSWLKF